MKLFASKFYQTLVLNVATIVAIVVGLYQFAIRAFKENQGSEKTRKVIQTVLQFINAIVTQLQAVVDTDVPVVKVAQKTTKRRWDLIYYIRTWEKHMILLTVNDHGCVYTLAQEDGDELYYAPIYTNGTVNLEEFAPVDIDQIDMDQMEVFDIMRRLKLMSEVWQLGKWHKGGCNAPQTLIFYIRTWNTTQMSVTFQANYKEVFATATVEKIEQLVEDNYDLDDILEFIDNNSEDDFVSFYEDYVKVGENIGYDVVDAFVNFHGSMSYVENVEDAYHGTYYDEETFAEEYYNEIYGEVPAFLVVDWEATWKQSLTYDFDFVERYVFSSNF